MTTSGRRPPRPGRLAALAALLFVTFVCGGDAEPSATSTTSTTAPDTTTTTGAPTTTTSSLPPRPTTTTTPTESTTTVAGGQAEFAVSSVVFGESGHVVVTNVGTGPGDLQGFWFCQRPAYYEIPAVELAPGESVAVFAGAPIDPPPVGVAAAFGAGGSFGTLDAADGEIALYASRAFADPAAIVDYVEWGSAGHGRSAVAVEAGIWPSGGFVSTPPEALGIVAASVPTDTPADWNTDIGG